MVAKFSDLFPALVECFTIILCGYISGRVSLVTPNQGSGIGKFVSNFALPALLFKNMVELNFETVSWSFMAAVLLSKTTVFFLVLFLSVTLLKQRSLARGALYAIFTTQSNDFALGYPLVSALYSQTHEEFLQYIYLLAPISLLILNPIGFVLLEIDKNKSSHGDYMVLQDSPPHQNEGKIHIGESIDIIDVDEPEDCLMIDEQDTEVETKGFTAKTCCSILKGVLLNPLVFTVFVGLAGHFIFSGYLPDIIGNTLGTLGNAFSGAALFFLGLTMVGKISKQQGIGLLIPALLIIAKVLILPILIRQYSLLLSTVLPVYQPPGISSNSTNTSSYIHALSEFGYLYGTFPSAPTVVIYATQYGLETDRLAAGMVFCTTLSAPVMYISAWTLSMSSMSVDFFEKEVITVGKDTSIITLLCALWCIIIFVIGRKFNRVPHAVTLAYIFSIVLSSLGTIFWDSFADTCKQPGRLFLFGMLYFGVKSSRLYVASLALTTVLILWKGQRFVWNNCFIFIITPLILSFIVTVALMSSTHMNDIGKDGVFVYGKQQDVVSFVVLLFSFTITVICLICIAKMRDFHYDAHSPESPLLPKTSSSYSSSDNESSSSRDRTFLCCSLNRCTTGDIQLGRHIVLLVLLCLSLFLGICLVAWRLWSNEEVGVYFEVAFLDCVFNFGQGAFIFCLFGFDSDLIIDPFIRLYQKLRYGSETVSLPDLSAVDKAALLQCLQFTRHHLNDCKLDIVKDHRSGLILYQNVFTGTELCDWILDRGLVNDRAEAQLYGKNLLLGRVLYHHSHRHYFYDRKYLYQFEEPKTCYRLKRTRDDRSLDSKTSENVDVIPKPSNDSMPHSLAFSPQRRTYFGYSFEAHVSGSDNELPSSLRKSRTRKYGAVAPKIQANDNDGEGSSSKLPRKKSMKKVFPNRISSYPEDSDSSFN